MEVAGFFVPILSVLATLLKSRFFVIYFRGVTLADGSDGQWPPLQYFFFHVGASIAHPQAFVAIPWNSCYNTPNESEGDHYAQNFIRLPREDLTQERHTRLCNAIPRFATGLPHLYYSHTTFENNHILPQHDENNSR